MGLNLYFIDFENWWDKDRILEGRPWTFDGYLLALVDFDGLTPVEELDFEKAAFWARMFHLPLACMGKEVGMQIGATVWEVEDVDVLDDGVGWGGESIYVSKSVLISPNHLLEGELSSFRTKITELPLNMRNCQGSVSLVVWSCMTVESVETILQGRRRGWRRRLSTGLGCVLCPLNVFITMEMGGTEEPSRRQGEQKVFEVLGGLIAGVWRRRVVMAAGETKGTWMLGFKKSFTIKYSIFNSSR